MTILAIDWGYALLVTGMGIGTVFLLLIVLIWVIGCKPKSSMASQATRKGLLKKRP